MRICLTLSVLAVAVSAFASQAQSGSAEFKFNDAKDLAGWATTATGDAAKRMPKPKIEGGKLYLLESWEKSSAAVAGPAPADSDYQSIDLSWKLDMNTGTEGAGFLWLDTAKYGTKADVPEVDTWEEPSLANAFGVGFDASDPANRDPFRGSGNIMDRPQHEVSLHWNGQEIVKEMTPHEFRDEKDHLVRLHIEFVSGGAEITLKIDSDTIYDRYFIPSMTAYVGRPAFGARNGDTAGDILMSDLQMKWSKPMPAPEAPLDVVAIDHVLNDVKDPTHEAMVNLPENSDKYGRIVCTLRLDKPATRFDPWDRIAQVFVEDSSGQKWEILRYITPYGRGFVWQVDVSDFRPLLQGKTKIVQSCGTQGEGWVVTVSFQYYPGKADRLARKVVKLWSGAPEIGNPDKPVSLFYQPQTVQVPSDMDYAAVRTVVTGHGMEPNSDNAGEFMPIWRTLTVNGSRYRNRLWKTDNYLNPCRPQGGTWKYDRAGWGPGTVVAPWEVDVSNLLRDSRTLHIDYTLDKYVNKNRGKTWAPTHVTESYLIEYQKPRH